MPKGTRHELTGRLIPGDLYPILQVDGGGEWRLDIASSWRTLSGRRVLVTGVRDGFDLIAVDRIQAL